MGAIYTALPFANTELRTYIMQRKSSSRLEETKKEKNTNQTKNESWEGRFGYQDTHLIHLHREQKKRFRELEHAVLALATRGKQGNKLPAKMKDFHSI